MKQSFTGLDVVDTGKRFAQENMDWDERCLQSFATRKRPLLRFYSWKKPSISFGRLLEPKKFLNLQAIDDLGIDIALRPSGGGIVFHWASFAFSFFLSPSSPIYALPSIKRYQIINTWTKEALIDLGFDKLCFGEEESLLRPDFCMARPTIYDLLMHGKKFAGAAQRKCKSGLLHQAVIVLQKSSQSSFSAIFRDQKLFEEIEKKSTSLLSLDSQEDCAALHLWKRRLVKALTKSFSKAIDSFANIAV